uniref:Anaphase-promoting complex subunit 1 n=1 Tax=Kalanchoe fedtschenkoi TaxID=63787 RepID=A0A7N0U9Q1_KALFE
MSVGTRHLTVLGEFKPYGLIAEALDGKPPPADQRYHYFLFDPEVARERGHDSCEHGASTSTLTDRSDHELFIRGKRIIWSTGSRVFKRFTLPNPVIMVSWCRLFDKSVALLCVLQISTLTIYNTSGEIVSIPLPRTVTSIWALPCGLLLQHAAEGMQNTKSVPFVTARDKTRLKREYSMSPENTFSSTNVHSHYSKEERALMSSHIILKDPLEEPQSLLIEERGKLSMMKEFNEKTIWTSDLIPFMASYHEGKMQHSLWAVELVRPCLVGANSLFPENVPTSLVSPQYSFRRVWQAKGAQRAASKIFLATDEDAAPMICFLVQEQRKLLTVALQGIELNNEIIFDVKPDVSWCLPAIAAAPVTVVRRAKAGVLPFTDIIVLNSDNDLLLYSGKQCLCRYLLPFSLSKDQHISGLQPSASSCSELRINGLIDPVEGRINIITSSGQIFRCALQRSLSSSLVDDCIAALSEGLPSTSYYHFLKILWGDDSRYLCQAESKIDSEWESFCSVILQLCNKAGLHVSSKVSDSSTGMAWEFIVRSSYHRNYGKLNFFGSSDFVKPAIPVSDACKYAADCTENEDKSLYFELLEKSLCSLHAVYECMKLDTLRKRDLGLLVVLLRDIADCLSEESYLDHYIRDFPGISKNLSMNRTLKSCSRPPNLFRWLENCLRLGCNSTDSNDLPPLVCKDGGSVMKWARKIVAFYSILCGAERMGKKLSSGVYCSFATGSSCNKEELTVLAMVGERFGLQHLDLLPVGVSLPLRHALDKCRENPPAGWPATAYALLGREDLAVSCMSHSGKSKEIEKQINVNLIAMSTPYMLHVHPVTTPSTISESVGLEPMQFEDGDVDGSLADGMEHIFNSSTQLRYGRDLRLNEARRLLCSARPVAIQTSVNPSASDQDLQQAQLWQLAQRTTALPVGRGAFTLATTHTLLTETLTVPKLVLAGRLPAQQNATVNLDPNLRNVQELRSWPEFHNSVAAGLRLDPIQGKMSRTWIIYNRPEDPNVVHAGLLFALGLHGHLRVLSITDIYQYLSQEHESTTIGLMLGLGAAYRGTMQPAISKSLYFHIPGRHSSSFPELELPTILQSAALMSIGLLFEGSSHPPTMQILLGEMGRRSGGDNVLEREGHAVSAGFSLGLVGLGRGKDELGIMDTVVSRLFQYIGGRESSNTTDGALINVDVTAPGAIIALALIFLKTESLQIVSRLSIPHTRFDLQYVRPDFIMLRVIAQNLIMWSRIHPSKDWVQSQIPAIVKNGVKGLLNDMDDADEMDTETFAQAYVNILTGVCISLGLRYAGTRDDNAQELLYEHAIYFLNEIKTVSAFKGTDLPKGLCHYVDRGTLEMSLHLTVLSLSVIMAGSGHLRTLKLLKFLRGRNAADGHSNYGTQMAVSLATGFLFLGGGMRTFSTNHSSVASLLITLYPRLPTGPNDNRCHLQAFRHLYVLATEARWIQTVDVDSGLPVYAPLEVTIKETEHYAETSFCEVTPCMLPERDILKSVRVCGPRYWPQVIELNPEDKPWWISGDKNEPFNSGILYIKRKVGACSYVDDPVGCQSLLSRTMHKVFGLTSIKDSSSSSSDDGLSSTTIDQLISTFSSDPSLIAFAQLCCNSSWNIRSDKYFQEFCLQVLFECVTKDRTALLQVYLSLYTTMGFMASQVAGGSGTSHDSLFISSLKLALAYNDAVIGGRLSSARGSIIQPTFIGSMRKRVQELLADTGVVSNDLPRYLKQGKWPDDESRSVLLSWYLQWFSLPNALVLREVLGKIESKCQRSSSVPLLRLMLPQTHINGIAAIDKLRFVD